jgi:hypothetical protein
VLSVGVAATPNDDAWSSRSSSATRLLYRSGKAQARPYRQALIAAFGQLNWLLF